jgi:hypothetical protein
VRGNVRVPAVPVPVVKPTTQAKARTTTAPAPKKTTAPDPAPSGGGGGGGGGGVVRSGAFCSPAGAVGINTSGKAVVCRTTATDSRLRWRAA